MFDWNDIKALLAVARTGSTAGAARELGVNQTTVARRLEALERDLGVRLVERSQTGASLTEAGLNLVADSEAMEKAAHALKQKVDAHRRGVSGVLRVTLSEMAATAAVTPMLPEFRQQYPDLALELVITDVALDLAAGEADVAIRGGFQLPDSNLVARKVHETPWALYCSQDYKRRVGVPATPADLKNHTVMAGEGDARDFPGLGHVLRDLPDITVTLRSSSMMNLFASIRAGLGIGAMPCVMGDAEADLVQVFPPHPDSLAYTWIITRPELKDSPRVRAFIDFFAPRFNQISREYEARAAAARAAAEGSGAA